MSLKRIGTRTLLAAALLGASAWPALAAPPGGQPPGVGREAAPRIAPPPRPAIRTVTEPGEPLEVMQRHRQAHSHNEMKIRQLMREKERARPAPGSSGIAPPPRPTLVQTRVEPGEPRAVMQRRAEAYAIGKAPAQVLIAPAAPGKP